MTLEEKEIDILRNAIDIAEKRKGRQTVSDPDVKKIISILEDFLKKNDLFVMAEPLLIIFFL
jgi:histone H3/H4